MAETCSVVLTHQELLGCLTIEGAPSSLLIEARGPREGFVVTDAFLPKPFCSCCLARFIVIV